MFGIDCNEASVDAFATEVADQFASARFVADLADERNFRAQAGGGDGLVGTFSAGPGEKIAALNGFAGSRERFCLDDVIGVDATEDNDARLGIFPGHSKTLRERSRLTAPRRFLDSRMRALTLAGRFRFWRRIFSRACFAAAAACFWR